MKKKQGHVINRQNLSAFDLTRQKEKNLLLFKDALKECLKKQPFEKIAVGDILEVAGRSRQTFYRCCDNRYDLVNRYLGMTILKCYREMKKGLTLREALTLKFRILEPEKGLFAQAFISNDYESLHRYTHRLIYAIYLDMNEVGKKAELSEKQEMLLDMYCEESIYAMVKWTCQELERSPAEMADLLIDAMPEKLKKVYSIYLDR